MRQSTGRWREKTDLRIGDLREGDLREGDLREGSKEKGTVGAAEIQ